MVECSQLTHMSHQESHQADYQGHFCSGSNCTRDTACRKLSAEPCCVQRLSSGFAQDTLSRRHREGKICQFIFRQHSQRGRDFCYKVAICHVLASNWAKSTRMLILINGDRCSITYDLRTKFQSESWEVETLQRGAIVILKRDYPALLVGVLPENQTILSAPGMLLSQQATTSSV